MFKDSQKCVGVCTVLNGLNLGQIIPCQCMEDYVMLLNVIKYRGCKNLRLEQKSNQQELGEPVCRSSKNWLNLN